jgi:hypothetical protein
MREHSESVFLVEGLQPSWLSTRAQRLAYGAAIALSRGLIVGLIVGPIVGLVFGPLFGRGFELVFGFVFGLSVGLSILVGIGLGCWSESPSKNRLISGLISVPIGGLSFLVGSGLLFGSESLLRTYTDVVFGLSMQALLLGGGISGCASWAIAGFGIFSLNHIRSQCANLFGYFWIDRILLLGEGWHSKAECQPY